MGKSDFIETVKKKPSDKSFDKIQHLESEEITHGWENCFQIIYEYLYLNCIYSSTTIDKYGCFP